ncbi:MAG TPA: cytochrome c oxidase subunit 3 family protein [Pyrinomonadaceae bacterium]|nr:cytochrome c oxidase subunit 3 family protein [Pyrinomonadaceae bacterium]
MAHAETLDAHGDAAHHDAAATHHASSNLAHHFDNLEQQREAGSLGMWLFLVTEIMFFGGLFTGYIIYRMQHPQAFAIASSTLNWKLGALNTVVLIVSSLTMALAVYFAQMGSRRSQIIFLVLTMLLGAVFLVVKGFEYADKFEHHHFPGLNFQWNEAVPAGVSTHHIQMFYWIYFAMTGLHALHMIIGIGAMLFLIYYAYRGRYTPEYHAPVELTGLYWHFVDIVWIFLFPLLYLLGAHLTGGGGGGAH